MGHFNARLLESNLRFQRGRTAAVGRGATTSDRVFRVYARYEV